MLHCCCSVIKAIRGHQREKKTDDEKSRPDTCIFSFVIFSVRGLNKPASPLSILLCAQRGGETEIARKGHEKSPRVRKYNKTYEILPPSLARSRTIDHAHLLLRRDLQRMKIFTFGVLQNGWRTRNDELMLSRGLHILKVEHTHSYATCLSQQAAHYRPPFLNRTK